MALGVSIERLISKYVFDNNATASDILERLTLNLEYKEKINNLILTDKIFNIVDLELRYQNKNLNEHELDNIIGAKTVWIMKKNIICQN